MDSCPCCPGKLLRHIRATGIYWFCPTCRQEMPDLMLLTIKQTPHSATNRKSQRSIPQITNLS